MDAILYGLPLSKQRVDPIADKVRRGECFSEIRCPKVDQALGKIPGTTCDREEHRNSALIQFGRKADKMIGPVQKTGIKWPTGQFMPVITIRKDPVVVCGRGDRI